MSFPEMKNNNNQSLMDKPKNVYQTFTLYSCMCNLFQLIQNCNATLFISKSNVEEKTVYLNVGNTNMFRNVETHIFILKLLTCFIL